MQCHHFCDSQHTQFLYRYEHNGRYQKYFPRISLKDQFCLHLGSDRFNDRTLVQTSCSFARTIKPEYTSPRDENKKWNDLPLFIMSSFILSCAANELQVIMSHITHQCLSSLPLSMKIHGYPFLIYSFHFSLSRWRFCWDAFLGLPPVFSTCSCFIWFLAGNELMTKTACLLAQQCIYDNTFTFLQGVFLLFIILCCAKVVVIIMPAHTDRSCKQGIWHIN